MVFYKVAESEFCIEDDNVSKWKKNSAVGQNPQNKQAWSINPYTYIHIIIGKIQYIVFESHSSRQGINYTLDWYDFIDRYLLSSQND